MATLTAPFVGSTAEAYQPTIVEGTSREGIASLVAPMATVSSAVVVSCDLYDDTEWVVLVGAAAAAALTAPMATLVSTGTVVGHITADAALTAPMATVSAAGGNQGHRLAAVVLTAPMATVSAAGGNVGHRLAVAALAAPMAVMSAAGGKLGNRAAVVALTAPMAVLQSSAVLDHRFVRPLLVLPDRAVLKKGVAGTVFFLVRQAGDEPANLSSVTGISFSMVSRRGLVKVDATPAVVTQPEIGQVAVAFTESDLDTVGRYFGWFVLEADDLVAAAPTIGRIVLSVTPSNVS